MNEAMRIGRLYPQAGAPLGAGKPQKPLAAGDKQRTFHDLLQAQELKFSHHAETRMKQRGISLNTEQLSRIAGAIEQAEAKGAKDSLILYRDIAMIVNVPSKTVVTAMEGSAFQGSVFTQIDSAVVLT